MKKLIINCDDFGISKSANIAILECLNKKKATSTSILVNSKYFYHAINNYKKKLKSNKIGIHLNITEGKALSKKSFMVLTDGDNNFNIKPEMLFLYNYFKINKIKKAIYFEFKKQIQNVIKSNLKITHIDTHQHVHYSPFVFKIIKTLSKEFNINKIRKIDEKFNATYFLKNFKFKIKNNNYLKYFLLKIFKRKKFNKKNTSDYFFGILNSGKIQLDELLFYIDKINDNKTIEVCIHPSNNINKKIDSKFYQFYENKNRQHEKELLLSKKFKNELIKRRVRILPFSDY
tara:strand:+ start:1731 stop:2594 length:864 start_codon:yes stop_codon:yes gene_type:complete